MCVHIHTPFDPFNVKNKKKMRKEGSQKKDHVTASLKKINLREQ